MKYEVALKSKNIVTPTKIVEGIICCSQGKILSIESYHLELENITDVGDLYVLPGVIDPHVHINEPGRSEWEGFYSITKAAIVGGVTTLVDMPLNASPVTTTLSAFDLKINETKNKLHCNCGFWGGAIPENEIEIEGLIKKGVFGFKAFLTHSGIDEFPNITENDLRKVMPIIAQYNLPLLVHCELSEETEFKGDTTSYLDYMNSRPREWEDNAIELMIQLSKEFNCKVHVVHLSSSNSIEKIKKAKLSGAPVTCETAQHYLYFNAEEIENGKTEYKCAPPIREKENNVELYKALTEGIIDFVATDHSPCTPDLKELESGNFMKAWGGISSIQFALSSLWTVIKKNNGSIHQLIKWLSENPANFIGLGKTKGKIEIGYDADLIVFNPNEEFTVTESIIHHKNKITPYLNETLLGVVHQTYLNAKLVFNENEFVSLNQGKLLLKN